MSTAATIEKLTKDLQSSKAKVDQLAEQLEREKTRGRELFEQFATIQGEMQVAFGIDAPTKTARKHKQRTPLAVLKSAAASLVQKQKSEGKTAVEARNAVLESLTAEAKRELGLTALPPRVIAYIDKQLSKWVTAPKK